MARMISYGKVTDWNGNKGHRKMVQLQRTRRKKIGVPAEKSQFTEAMLLQAAKDLSSGRLKLERLRISDDRVVGLRAVVNRSGRITLHVSYEVGDDRPFKLLGSANKDEPDYISIEDARELAKTIKALGDRGINVDEVNDRRLIRELTEQGLDWNPQPDPPSDRPTLRRRK